MCEFKKAICYMVGGMVLSLTAAYFIMPSSMKKEVETMMLNKMTGCGCDKNKNTNYTNNKN